MPVIWMKSSANTRQLKKPEIPAIKSKGWVSEVAKFNIEIVVPEKIFFEGEIDALIVETANGKLGILAGHAPMVIGLHPSIITIRKDGEELIAANGDGFIAVHPHKTIVLCQTMEWPEEIDLNRVNREIEKGKKILLKAKNKIDYDYGTSTLQRAYARLNAFHKKNNKEIK